MEKQAPERRAKQLERVKHQVAVAAERAKVAHHKANIRKAQQRSRPKLGGLDNGFFSTGLRQGTGPYLGLPKKKKY